MSKDIIVLAPNGRRQKVHCTPDTSILQVLEDVCEKQGFQPTEYNLKHHNHVLDLTLSVRFSNLPNKATLEMVEAVTAREETSVTIGLLLEDGERRTAEFSPHTSLFDLLTSMAPTELGSLPEPTVLYMRQEVTGVIALRAKTLRQLGLIKGRAILRLKNKCEEGVQANVSSVYRRPTSDIAILKHNNDLKIVASSEEAVNTTDIALVNKALDPIQCIKEEKQKMQDEKQKLHDEKPPLKTTEAGTSEPGVEKMEEDVIAEPSKAQLQTNSDTYSQGSIMTRENLERRLKIEEEVTFLGTQKAIAFLQAESEEDYEDLPDDFYDLTIEEVRKLYHNLQQERLQLENMPLISGAKRNEATAEDSKRRLNMYKHVVVRIQFPDHVILQGIFEPSNTIEDIYQFVKDHLQFPNQQFHIFTTPFKETLDPRLTLAEAKFVPCVHMHFKWVNENEKEPYLKHEIHAKITPSDAAGILASKYRAPSRRKFESSTQKQDHPSTSKSKVPKWFKK